MKTISRKDKPWVGEVRFIPHSGQWEARRVNYTTDREVVAYEHYIWKWTCKLGAKRMARSANRFYRKQQKALAKQSTEWSKA